MPRPILAQTRLFGADDEDHSPAARTVRSNVMPLWRPRAATQLDAEYAAILLDSHNDYRVLRRLKPRPVDATYQIRPDESIALLVNVETTVSMR